MCPLQHHKGHFVMSKEGAQPFQKGKSGGPLGVEGENEEGCIVLKSWRFVDRFFNCTICHYEVNRMFLACVYVCAYVCATSIRKGEYSLS